MVDDNIFSGIAVGEPGWIGFELGGGEEPFAVDRVEIKAQVAMSSLRRLFIGRQNMQIDIQRLSEEFAELIALEPVVRLDMGNHVAEWQAEFVRFSDTVDPETQRRGNAAAARVELAHEPVEVERLDASLLARRDLA